MPKAAPKPKPPTRPRFTKGSRRGKVRKEFWLDPQLLKVAQEELGAATEREAVELALDLVAFRRELIQGTRRLQGLQIASFD
jgi:Arc/MetJ family transcription regulator